MRRIALVLLLALAACNSSVVRLTPPGGTATVRSVRRPLTSALPPGTYLAALDWVHDTIRYYDLSGPMARFAGEAHVEIDGCSMSGTHVADLDRQKGIDFDVNCSDVSGFVQVPGGIVGSVRPTRTILTRFAKYTYIFGSIDGTGVVALTSDSTTPRKPVAHEVLVYDRNASGDARPSYWISLRSPTCASQSESEAARAGADGLDFSDDGTLNVEIGPAPCGGGSILERFPPGSRSFASWFRPDLAPKNAAHRVPFENDFHFIVGQPGKLLFGAYIGYENRTGGRNGAVEYSTNASGVNPAPLRVFSDSDASFGGRIFREVTPVGIDRAGNAYLKLVQGEDVNGRFHSFNHLEVFGPSASTDKPSRTISVPEPALSYAAVIIDIPPRGEHR